MTLAKTARLIVLILLIPAGCQVPDRELNSQSVPLELRIHNATRAAVLADIVSPQAEESSAVKAQPTVAPAQTQSSPPFDSDGMFVGLAISGGGSRSANFAAAVMFQLERAGLLQKVDYISTVSGGSLAGAYYCAADDSQWNPGSVQQQLSYHFASDLIRKTLLPWNDVAFIFTDWNRSDLLAGVFASTLLGRNGKPLTFADLRSDRPRLLINSTDIQSARRFIFCNETFDDMNLDLSRYPLAYAVAASSAVPVILHPVALQDFSTSYRQFRHLVDGGVVDNLGVQTLVETYSAQVRSAVDQGRPNPYPRGSVFILVDAHTRFNTTLSNRRDLGLLATIRSAAGLTSTVLVNRASSATLAEMIVNGAADSETAAQMRQDIETLNRDNYLRFTDKRGNPVRVLYISLSSVRTLQNLPSGSFDDNVNNIGTYFNISQEEAHQLYQAADLLMKEKLEPYTREILGEMK